MVEPRLGIIELLQRVGEDEVRVQFLHSDMTDVRTNSKHTETHVTFATDPDIITATDVGRSEVRYVGMVVWMPAGLVEEARRANAAGEPIRA